jgi:hypothetical protein
MTCRQTRAMSETPCEPSVLSYEVASEVSTDTSAIVCGVFKLDVTSADL